MSLMSSGFDFYNDVLKPRELAAAPLRVKVKSDRSANIVVVVVDVEGGHKERKKEEPFG